MREGWGGRADVGRRTREGSCAERGVHPAGR